MTTIKERLKERREKAGLTQGQVSEYEEISRSYISNLERGQNAPEVWGLLAKLAKRYNTSTDYLLGLTDDPRPLTALQAVSEEKAEYRTHNTETLNEAQRAVLQFFDSLSEEEQDFVFGLIHWVQQRNTPRIIE